MSLTFYLMNEKGYKTLVSAIDVEPNLIDAVISSKDPNVEKDFFIEIRSLCLQYDIDFYERKEYYKNQSLYSLAVGWRWLIPEIKNLIVIHDSLLPRYRGFSPLVNMLINKEKFLGATAIFANSKMDEGDIIMQKSVEIQYPIKIQSAIEVVAKIYEQLVRKILEEILAGKLLKSYPQDENYASYSIWRDKKDYRIDWEMDAEDVERFINSVGFPYSGAYSLTEDGQKIKIFDAKVLEVRSEIKGAGKLLMYDNFERPVILCGNNALVLSDFQSEDGEKYIFKKFRTRLV